jgi:hypothetical protein
MELFAALGRITVVESMINQAAEAAAERAWRGRLSGVFDRALPNEGHWHTSMHVSSFSGDDPRACPRKLAYGLMAFADSEPLPQRVPAAGIVGTAIEDWLVSMLGYDGRVLSAKADAEHQIDFEDADHWLTGSPDLVVLPRFWNRPLVVEVKSEKVERVSDMRELRRPPWPKHVRQCRGYVGLGSRISQDLWPASAVCKHTWRLAEPGIEPVLDAMVCPDHGIHDDSGCLQVIDLLPINAGVVVYCARDNPEIRCSWYFEHDEAWFQKGLAVLRRVQEHFAHDLIPAHPFGGKQWSVDPCRFCEYKKFVCRQDTKEGIARLTDSHGVAWSKDVYGEHAYSPETIRRRVLERWRGREGYGYHLPPGYEIGRYGVQRERIYA